MTTTADRTDPAARFSELTALEAALQLDSFNHADAWQLGSRMVARAVEDDLTVIVDIRRPGLLLFRAALPGTNAENQAWVERKARTVLRFEAGTATLSARFAARGVDLATATWFDSRRFTTNGGAVPVRVRGVGVVAVVTVAGLTSEEDHDFAITSLQAFHNASS